MRFVAVVRNIPLAVAGDLDDRGVFASSSERIVKAGWERLRRTRRHSVMHVVRGLLENASATRLPVTTGPSQQALCIVQEAGNLNTMDPNRLSIEVTERLLEYAPEVYARWRDPAWWDAEGWREVVPEAEWHRVLTHMRTQAIGGYHFVEVMYMRVVPATPDIFVYRQDEAVVPVRFVELKHKDAIAPR